MLIDCSSLHASRPVTIAAVVSVWPGLRRFSSKRSVMMFIMYTFQISDFWTPLADADEIQHQITAQHMDFE